MTLMLMWFILIDYAEEMDMVNQVFDSYDDAETYRNQIAKVNGPRYQIVHGFGWHQLYTTVPQWKPVP